MAVSDRLDLFRMALNKYKSDHFFEKLVNEVDDKSIDRRRQEAFIVFTALQDYVLDPEKHPVTDNELKKLVDYLGDPEEWSNSLPTQVQSILLSDLIEYPLTFNSHLIQQFKDLQGKQKFPNF